MSNYVQGALGYDDFKGEPASNFGWVLGLPTQNRAHKSQYGCGSRVTGKPYTGSITKYPCTGSPPASKGGGALWDYLQKTLLPSQQEYAGPSGAPSTTASNLLLPAVAVVGVVGILLIMKKKK
jgi:hypothetical protein